MSEVAEPEMIVNGRALTEEQVKTVRAGLTFLQLCVGGELYDEKLRAEAREYLDCAREIQRIIRPVTNP